MTTLEAIGFTLAGGSTVLAFCLGAFGVAVHQRSTFIAPRATARPANVIYNPHAAAPPPASSSKSAAFSTTKNSDDDDPPSLPTTSPVVHCQYRGNPMLGWVRWSLGLTYDTMLKGVPGTGTRQGGLTGHLLRVNMDGIILLRFHALCRRVAVLGTFLCLAILLPVYTTGGCYQGAKQLQKLEEAAGISSSSSSGSGSGGDSFSCNSVGHNLTNYERTTLANVPPITDDNSGWNVFSNGGITARLYCTVAVFWIICAYVMHLLNQEWVQVIAMRRVYYLEQDVWGERQVELKNTVLSDDDDDVDNDAAEPDYARKHKNYSKSVREPWIPHPEHRDTVPNVSLYSVLVGSLPSLPEQAVDAYDAEATRTMAEAGGYAAIGGGSQSSSHTGAAAGTTSGHYHARQSIDWQLSLTTTFFDHCVPNQPGFSSSVVAVTVIPGVRGIMEAWRKWYAAAGKLRRLKFIRREIERRKWQLQQQRLQSEEIVMMMPGSSIATAAAVLPPPTHRDQDDPIVPTVAAAADGDGGGDGREVISLRNEPPKPKKKKKKAAGAGAAGAESSRELNSEQQPPPPSQSGNTPAANKKTNGNGGKPGPKKAGGPTKKMKKKPSVETVASTEEMRPPSSSVLLGPPADDDDDRVKEALPTQQPPPESPREPKPKAPPPKARERSRSHHRPPDSGLPLVPIPIYQANQGIDLKSQILQKKRYVQQVVDECVHGDMDASIYDAIAFGPEQAAVYNREFAQSAAPCCPNGYAQERVLQMTLTELLDLEDEARQELAQANLELRLVRRKVAHTPDSMILQPRMDDQDDQFNINNEYTSALGGGGAVASLPYHNSKLESRRFSSDGPAAHHSALQDHSTNSLTTSEVFAVSQNKHALALPRAQRPMTMDASTALQDAFYKRGLVSEPPTKSTIDRGGGAAASGLSSRRTSNESEIGSASKLKFLPMNLETVTSTPKQGGEAAVAPESAISEHSLKLTYEEELSTLLPGRSSDYHHQDDSNTRNDDEDDFRNTAGAYTRIPGAASWDQVMSIVSHVKTIKTIPRHLATGTWSMPTAKDFADDILNKVNNVQLWARKQSLEAVDTLARDSTYAVVTFSSRQAAVAARNCLADGRGAGKWVALPDIPIPPLSDAAACDIITCRNCCRPVTMSINDRQKGLRKYCALLLLSGIYVFYTIPLTFASNLASQDNLESIFPTLPDVSRSSGVNIARLLSGIFSAVVWSTFFALCPVMFKSIANFGSGASSVAKAEYRALQYYWWFMIVTAFSGQLLASMVLSAIIDGREIGSEFRSVVRAIALTVPSTISASWLNWIIFRFTVILPWNYLLQGNTYLFYVLGLNCCSRLVRGGGPGGVTPYRIYVDSGVVLLTLFALAPASPLVAVAALIYFLVCEPLLRRNLIFMYRPKFDAGGVRWAFIFDMVISSLILAEILLITQMVLKQALGPSICAGLPLIPTLWFQQQAKKKYKEAFDDAGLLQASLLDGWNTAEESSVEKREEFRRFLVDAHKAAYVPVCIAGSDTGEFLTAEPAVVIPLETDVRGGGGNNAGHHQHGPSQHGDLRADRLSRAYGVGASLTQSSGRMQSGATLRRTGHLLRRNEGGSITLNGSSTGSFIMHGGDGNYSTTSPFTSPSSRRLVVDKAE